jgi:hypothetical protein
VSTSLLDIHKSNEAKMVVAFASLAFGDHNRKYFFHKLGTRWKQNTRALA